MAQGDLFTKPEKDSAGHRQTAWLVVTEARRREEVALEDDVEEHAP